MLSRCLAAIALAAGPVSAVFPVSTSCPANVPVSCQNTTVYEDTCCFNHPGGQVLLTQFWDTNPSTGPADSWTIHGLWPDNCDGTWEEYCDKDREYFNITAILEPSAPCTLQYMQKFWKDYNGDDEDFWEHEFNKHGTCMSSLEPACYPDYEPGHEVIDYFKRTVKLFKTLPSYEWLAEAGIVPSTTATYSRAEIQAVLRAHHGHDVIINCNRNRELNELWYHYNIRGSVQSGEYIPVEPVGSPSTCPQTGIRYLPKYSNPTPPTPTTTTTGPSPTVSLPPGLLSGKGWLYVETGSASYGGFLISAGKWYRQGGGTPATYTATPNAAGDAFTLKTSKGPCTIQSDSSLLCDASVSATNASPFGFDGKYLTYAGSSSFYSIGLPSGTAQGTVYTNPQSVEFKATWSPR
ncbi:ribonuclease T2-like protein [Stachybotrys elegans]|uniref:Ribonuclease T2-like n=1 Tax=Stachybotrys elegans TaxID=80388 RepID=A0A8K0WKD7_9HYPO|nr:ribonuclease T2-like protein [Stachybotrys elegans]